MRLNLLGLKMPGHGDALIGAGIPGLGEAGARDVCSEGLTGLAFESGGFENG